jgi:hypothetical protein
MLPSKDLMGFASGSAAGKHALIPHDEAALLPGVICD